MLRAPIKTDRQGNIEIFIEQGMGLYDVAYLLRDKGLIHDVVDFRWAAWFMRAERKIKPGYFNLQFGSTHEQLLIELLKGGILTKNVTIPEGKNIKQIAGIIQAELDLDSTEFVRLCQDSLFIAELNITADNLEGYLFPETYNFYVNTDLMTVIRKMTQQFFAIFDDSLQSKLSNVGLSLHEAVTLASIIQGEIMLESEATMVSAVYLNRIRRGMLLGADPTIQYIIPDGPRRLLNKDLRIDSKYNTYRYRGLPPGPINNPGRTALRASVNPADSNVIYMVAWGDGSHAFNETMSGHERDKANLRKARRKITLDNRNK